MLKPELCIEYSYRKLIQPYDSAMPQAYTNNNQGLWQIIIKILKALSL